MHAVCLAKSFHIRQYADMYCVHVLYKAPFPLHRPFIVFIDLMRIGDVRVIPFRCFYVTANKINKSPITAITHCQRLQKEKTLQCDKGTSSTTEGSSIIIIKHSAGCCCYYCGYRLILDSFVLFPIAVFSLCTLTILTFVLTSSADDGKFKTQSHEAHILPHHSVAIE